VTTKALYISRAAIDKLASRTTADTPDLKALTDSAHAHPKLHYARGVVAQIEEVQQEIEQVTFG
jgi:hypothetical protein